MKVSQYRMRPQHRSLPPQPSRTPALEPGERRVMEGQCVYRRQDTSGWRPARCLLSNRRLFLYLLPGFRLSIPLGDIFNLTEEKRYCVLNVRKTLKIHYRPSGKTGPGRLWFVADGLPLWKEKIHQLSLLEINLDLLERIGSGLDNDCRDILLYLWENRHARIHRLADLIEAPSHMDVLVKIKEMINPMARRIIGCPVLSFETSRVDPETGESVSFSWWLMGRKNGVVYNEHRLVDIFDEGEYFQVIMEAHGLAETDLRLDFLGDQVTVRSHKPGAFLRHKLLFPVPVDPQRYTLEIKNDLLELDVWKK